ncbi:MAG: SDR family NAD(P)-dependent oxidoreductase [Fimbriimonas sp.]
MTQYQRAIVVGASSGIGLEIARQLAQNGTRVAVVARRAERLADLAQAFPDRVLPIEHDVKDYDAVPALFQDVTRKLGGLDLIVYAAGVMPTVEAHEYDFDKDREMIEVNLLGAMAWLNQAAVRFEGTRAGTIVGIGSVAGDRGRAGQPAYNTSKAALATYLEALRNRLAKYGVRVVTIKPGPTATEMTSHLPAKGMMEPAEVARITLAKAGSTGEHYVKLAHRLIFAVIRHIPSGIFRKLPL